MLVLLYIRKNSNKYRGRKGMKPREYKTVTSDPARKITNCKGWERKRFLLFQGPTHISVYS